MKSFFGFTYGIIVLLTILSAFVPWIPAYFFPLLQFLPFFSILFLAIHLLALLILRKKWWGKLLAFSAIAVCGWIIGKDFRYTLPTNPPSKAIKVLSFNVQNFQFERKNIDSLILLLKQEQPDIVCLQEFRIGLIPSDDGKRFNPKTQQLIAAKLGFPHYDFTAEKGHLVGTAYFSRFPLTDMDTIYMDKKHTNSGVIMTFRTPQGELGVANIHLTSYHLPKEKRNQPVLKKLNDVVLQISRIMPRQMEFAMLCNEKIKKYAHPLIVTGDMNAMPHTSVVQTVKGNLRDSFLHKGMGWGFTYPMDDKWGIRIDYQFFSSPLSVWQYRIRNDVRFSDHYPAVGVYTMP
ncbi:MAG: endonuclease/exonuclease/phosphatase family protein [Bacteroidia bacterium]|nr:endonuclease/exonuclease/phosphatase family protein [Bacteroidia bacterium]